MRRRRNSPRPLSGLLDLTTLRTRRFLCAHPMTTAYPLGFSTKRTLRVAMPSLLVHAVVEAGVVGCLRRALLLDRSLCRLVPRPLSGSLGLTTLRTRRLLCLHPMTTA